MMEKKMDGPAPLAGVKLVAFDLDGTILDAFEDIAAAATALRKRYGRPPVSVEEVKLHVGRGARRMVAGVLDTEDEQVIEENYQALVSYYLDNAGAHAKIYPGVTETVQALHAAGYRMAVASNKPHPLSVKIMEVLGLSQYFEWVIGESADFAHKPAPAILHYLMEQAGCTPEQTVVVGDSCVDIKFARAAGARVVALTYGQTSEAELRAAAPDFVLGSMPELLPLLGL